MSALGMLWLVPTETRFTRCGLMSCVRMRSIITAIPGCVSEPDGCGLMEIPGEAKVHGAPSLPEIISGLNPPPRRAEEAAVGLEPGGRGGEAQRRHLRGPPRRSPAARPAWKGLVMVPKFSRSPPACVAPSDSARRVASRSRAEELRGRRRRADRAAGGRAVEAVLVMARRDRLGDLALDFHADLVGQHEVRTAAPVALRDRERGRQRGRRGMGEQPVDAVLRHGELRVVEVVGVDREAVGERGEARRQAQAAADHGAALSAAMPERLEVAARDVAALRGGAGEREPDAVEHRALAEVRDSFGMSAVAARRRKPAT
jgi:hypothetical protein